MPRRGLTAAEIVVALVILGVLAALLLPAVQQGTGPNTWRRDESRRNLKGLSLAAHNMASASDGAAPPAFTVDAEGRPLHGWATFLIPGLRSTAFYDTIDFAAAWDAPVQGDAFENTLPEFRIPRLEPIDGPHPSIDYAANGRVLKVRPADSPLTPTGSDGLFGAADGLGQTLLFGEIVDARPPWGRPGNVRDPAAGLNAPGGFGSPWVDGCQFTFCDGSARFLSDDIAPEVLRALSTPAAGDQPGDAW